MSLQSLFEVCSQLFKPDQVSTVLDIGSRDCLEAMAIAKNFPHSNVYSFECHPDSYIKCIENTKNHDNIKVFNTAAHNFDGKTKFYPIDPSRTVTTWADGNPGASSLFKASGEYDFIEKYVQNEIEVDCTRIDTWANQNNIKQVDIVWMDLQGAELLALQGFGDLLKTVKVIHTEVEVAKPIYTGQALYKEIDTFLTLNNFVYVNGNLNVQFGTDVIYINKDFLV